MNDWQLQLVREAGYNMGKKQKIKKNFFLLLMFSVILCIFTTCILFPPAHAYKEIKRIGITLDDNNISFLFDAGIKKSSANTYLSAMAIFKYSSDVNHILTRKINERYQEEEDVADYQEALIFSIPIDWGQEFEHYWFYSDSFIFNDRRFSRLNIRIEKNENKYILKKRTDHKYIVYNDLLRGSGYLEENIEYIIVFYPFRDPRKYYKQPAIPPIRFTILHGVPVIWINDY